MQTTHDITLPKTTLGKLKMDKICKAARLLFSLNGFLHTSINDICKKANIATGTFYIYFEDKTALYHHLVKCYTKQMLDEVEAAINKNSNISVKQRLLVGIKRMIMFCVENPDFFGLTGGSLAVKYNFLDDFVVDISLVFKRTLLNYSKKLSLYPDIDTLSFAIFGIATFACYKILLDTKVMDESMIDDYVDNCLSPILPSVD